MLNEKENQCVIISGESGAGKTGNSFLPFNFHFHSPSLHSPFLSLRPHFHHPKSSFVSSSSSFLSLFTLNKYKICFYFLLSYVIVFIFYPYRNGWSPSHSFDITLVIHSTSTLTRSFIHATSPITHLLASHDWLTIINYVRAYTQLQRLPRRLCNTLQKCLAKDPQV